MEEQVQMNEKLRALLEKAKREKKIASKDLIDTLEAIDADEKQTELIYEALDEAGLELVGRYDGYTASPAAPMSERIVYAARRVRPYAQMNG